MGHARVSISSRRIVPAFAGSATPLARAGVAQFTRTTRQIALAGQQGQGGWLKVGLRPGRSRGSAGYDSVGERVHTRKRLGQEGHALSHRIAHVREVGDTSGRDGPLERLPLLSCFSLA